VANFPSIYELFFKLKRFPRAAQRTKAMLSPTNNFPGGLAGEHLVGRAPARAPKKDRPKFGAALIQRLLCAKAGLVVSVFLIRFEIFRNSYLFQILN